MKRLLLFVLMAVVFLTGCVEYGLIVKVSTDGSGEIVENMLLSNQVMNMAKAMKPGENSTQAFTKEKQQKKASTFGEGVVFSTYDEIKTEGKQGYKAVYKFSDINKVKISENMINGAVDELTESDQYKDNYEQNSGESDKFLTFEYSARKKGALTIINGFYETDDLRDDDNDYIDDEEYDYDEVNIDQQLAMAKVFVQGMKFYTKVEFNSIKSANVPYENNQITLFEVDMDKLMENTELYKNLIKNDDKEISRFLNNEEKIDGITFHNLDKITVDFK